MTIIKQLRAEEARLRYESTSIIGRLEAVRAAIEALGGTKVKPPQAKPARTKRVWKNKGATAKIRGLLRRKSWRSAKAISLKACVDMTVVCAELWKLHKAGKVERTGEPGAYRYRLKVAP